MFTHVFVGPPRTQSACVPLFFLSPHLPSCIGCTSLPQGQAGGQSAAESASGSAVLRATLDNGLRVIIVRNPLAPVVTQELTFFAGANQSPPGFPAWRTRRST